MPTYEAAVPLPPAPPIEDIILTPRTSPPFGDDNLVRSGAVFMLPRSGLVIPVEEARRRLREEGQADWK